MEADSISEETVSSVKPMQAEVAELSGSLLNFKKQVEDFQENLDFSSFYPLIHFLTLNDELVVNPNFGSLHELSKLPNVAKIPNFAPYLEAKRSQLNNVEDTEEAISKFIEENLTVLCYWKSSLICVFGKETGQRSQQLGELASFVDSVIAKISKVFPKYPIFPVSPSLSQIQKLLEELNAKISELLGKTSSDLQNIQKSELTEFQGKAEDFLNLVKEVISIEDLMLKRLPISTISEFRAVVEQFAMAAPHISRAFPEIEMTSTCSSLLFFLDSMLQQVSVLAGDLKTPLDLLIASKHGEEATKKLIDAQIEKFKNSSDFLNNLLVFYTHLQDAISPLATINVVDNSRRIFNEMLQYMFKFCTILAKYGYYEESAEFERSIFHFKKAADDLEFTKQGRIKVQMNDVVDHKLEYRENFVKVGEKIAAKRGTIKTDFISIMSNYINPSKRSRSFSNLKQVELLLRYNQEKQNELYANCLSTIQSSIEKLNEIEGNTFEDYLKIVTIAQDLSKVSVYVDMISNEKDIIDPELRKSVVLYHDVAHLLNDKLDKFVDACIQPFSEFSSPELLKIITYIIDSVLESAKGAAELNQELTREEKETEERLIPIKEHIANFANDNKMTIEQMVSIIEEDRKSAEIVLEENKKKFDQANRDFFIRKFASIFNKVVDAFNEQCKKYESNEFEIEDVTSEIRSVELALAGILEAVIGKNEASIVGEFSQQLISVIHSLCLIETGLNFEFPRKLIPKINALPDELASLWDDIKLLLPSENVSRYITALKQASWKIRHISSYYKHDENLLTILSGLKDLFQEGRNKEENGIFVEFFSYKVSQISPIIETISSKTPRSGDEDSQWSALFGSMINEICSEWKPPRSLPFIDIYTQSCEALNKAIEELGKPTFKVQPFENPLDNIQASQQAYKDYLVAAGEKYGDKKFWAVVKDASQLLLPRDIEKTKSSIKSINKFIETDVDNLEGPIKREFAENILFSFAAGKLGAYKGMNDFVTDAVKFISEENAVELGDISLNLLNHCINILKLSDPNEAMKKIEHQQFLLQSYIDPSANDLGTVSVLTKNYAESLEDEKIKAVFVSIKDQLLKCYFLQGKKNEINFDEAIEHLREQLPPELQLRKLSPEEEKNIIFNTHPLNVVEEEEKFVISKETSPHLYAFNDWALDSCAPTGKDFNFYIPPSLAMTVNKDMLSNELNLPDDESGHSTNFISTKIIARLTAYCAKTDRPPETHFSKLGQVYESMHKFTSIEGPMKIPGNDKFLHINLSKITVEGKVITGLIAMVYVYDFMLRAAVTQPAFYQSDSEGNMHLLNGSEVATFQINQPRKSTIIVCRLMHNMAADTAAFNKFLFSDGKEPKLAVSPYCFAVSYCAPLNDKLEFNENVKFPDGFHVVSSAKELENDSELYTALMMPPTQRMQIQMEYSHKYDSQAPLSPSYTWTDFKSKDLYLSSLLIQQGNTIPVITLRNISFSFQKPPKGKLVFFTAILVENDNDINKASGLPCAIDYLSPVQMNSYRSTCMLPSTSCNFPDIVQFNITKPLTEKAHIILYFNIFDGNAPKTYKISIIQLYDFEAKTWISDINGEIPLFEQKKIDDKGYIPLKKLNPNSKTHVAMTLPQLYFPHSGFTEIFNMNESTVLKPIDTPSIPKANLLMGSIPVTARILKYPSSHNIGVLINFLASFQNNDISQRIKQWTSNSFDPGRMGDKFLLNLLVGYGSYIQETLSAKPDGNRILNCINIIKTIPLMCNILTYATVLSYDENNEITKNDQIVSKFNVLINSVAFLVSSFYNLEIIIPAHESFARFLFLVSPLFESKVILNALSSYFKLTDVPNVSVTDLTPLFPVNVDPKSKIPPPPIPKPEATHTPEEVRCLQMKFSFMEIFMHTSNLIANAAFSEKADLIFSVFIDSIGRAFKTNDKALITSSIAMLAHYCRDIEQYSVITKQCARLLSPYLDLAVKYHTREEIKTDYKLLQHFVIPVLFVLHESDPQDLTAKYTKMSIDEQINFIDFLEYLVKAVLSPPSSKGTLGTIKQKTLSIEMRELSEMKTNSSLINYALFNEITMRIIEFLDRLIKAKVNIIPSMKQVISLLIQLLNRHQSSSSLRDVLLIICHIIDKNQKLFFTNHGEFFNIIMSTAIKLIMRHLRIARATGVALILHIFFIDYMCTKNIILTSHYFMDNYTKIFLDAPPHKLPIFGTVLDSIRQFIVSYRISSFVKLVTERLDAAKIIYQALLNMKSPNNSPEFQTEQIYTIADQFFTYPTLRLRWLQRAVEVNTKSSLWSSVFVTQLRIAALCKIIVERTNKEYLPALDFSFVPSTEEEEKVDILHANEKLRPLLVQDDDFSIAGIIKALEGAVFATKSGSLNRHLRYTLMQLVSLYELKKEFKILVGTVNSLSVMYGNLARDTQEPLNFYVLEKRHNGSVMSRKVFASSIPDVRKFVDWLNNPDDYRFEYGEQAIAFSTIAEASKVLTNTCVFPVKPKHSLIKNNTENEFIIDDPGMRFTFITAVQQPAAIASCDVAEYTENKLSDDEKLVETIKSHTETILNTSSMVKLMMPNAEFADKWQTRKPKIPIAAFTRQLDEASSQKLAEQIGSSAENNQSVKEAALELQKALTSATEIYQFASQMTGQASEVSRILAQVIKFSKVSLQEKNQKFNTYSSRSDPLTYKMAYEDF